MSIQTKYGSANLTADGYYMITSVKEGNFRKFVHRLIYEEHHGVTICPWAIIHHKDGNKLNNCIDNLELYLEENIQQNMKVQSVKKMQE